MDAYEGTGSGIKKHENYSKHTPGPWHVGGTMSIFDKDSEERIARDVQNPANAALIAAAPDMYEALDDAARLIGLILAGDEAVDTSDLEATYANINHALAKAEGR